MIPLRRHAPAGLERVVEGVLSAPAAAACAASSTAAAVPAGCAPGEVAVLLLLDVAPGSRLWGFARFVLGKWPLRTTPGLRFVRQMGSGFEGGFGLRPSATRQGLFLLFDSEASADAFLHAAALLDTYRSRARELCLVKLRAFSSRGSWAGVRFGVAQSAPQDGPIATLTRASIRPTRSRAFWRLAPATQASLEQAPGCRLAVGLGEAPLLRQATFSIWDSVGAMEDYARSGAHLDAIRAAQRDGFFSESMFVRFVPLSVQGVWKGRYFG